VPAEMVWVYWTLYTDVTATVKGRLELKGCMYTNGERCGFAFEMWDAPPD